ncbi:hypothetical protein M9434_004719 [Picochlorum sp. BPE23]|nr:hypothetical protein M9434_004719 [Picochlorum sp. BPE23]
MNGGALDRAPSSSLGSEPVLNEEQREALNAALSGRLSETGESVKLRGVPPPLAPAVKKQVGGEKKGGKLYHDHHLSRKTKGTGKAKKNGGGGKFTWGNLMDANEYLEDGVADEGDPNWDSEQEDLGSISLVEAKLVEIVAYKDAVVDILTEYFESGDAEEANQSIEELDQPTLLHFFVKKAITCSLDRHDKEREMISQLLSYMYNKTLSSSMVEKGFVAVLDALDDLVLDVPQAVEWVAYFTCRAVADDVLPPSFVSETGVFGSELVEQWHSLCTAYLSDPHFAERMSRVWGSRAGMDVTETKKSFEQCIKEFLSARDVGEVRRQVQSLAVPHFHHEFVKLTVLACFNDPNACMALVDMLSDLIATGDVNKSQTCTGLRRIASDLEQISLDYPNARTVFQQVIDAAYENQWIDGAEKESLASQGATESPSIFLLSTFKSECKTTIMEYFDSADPSEVECQLNQCGDPGLHSVFVKLLIQMAMDRNDRERELSSKLLNDLRQSSVLSEEHVSLGFTKLLSSAEDITLDIPDAPRFLTLFLGRAIVDEAVPPSFLSHLDEMKEKSLGHDIIHAARKLLAAKHAAERFTNCWHGYSTKETSRAISDAFVSMIKEYLLAKNFNELLKCLRDVGMPHYHHELVYQSVMQLLEDPSVEESVLELLAKLFICGEINVTQTLIGYKRLADGGDDLELDYIGAKERIKVIGDVFTMFGMLG